VWNAQEYSCKGIHWLKVHTCRRHICCAANCSRSTMWPIFFFDSRFLLLHHNLTHTQSTHELDMFDSACAPDSHMMPKTFFASRLLFKRQFPTVIILRILELPTTCFLPHPNALCRHLWTPLPNKAAESNLPVLFLAQPPLLSSQTTTGGGRTLWIPALRTTVAS